MLSMKTTSTVRYGAAHSDTGGHAISWFQTGTALVTYDAAYIFLNA